MIPFGWKDYPLHLASKSTSLKKVFLRISFHEKDYEKRKLLDYFITAAHQELRILFTATTHRNIADIVAEPSSV